MPEGKVRSTRALALGTVMGIVAVIGMWATAMSAGVLGTLVSVLLATVPAVIVALIVLLFDRFEPEPRGLLALTFAFGATGAATIALVFNRIGGNVATAALGLDTGTFVTTALIAPVVEEIAKGLAIYVVMRRLKDRFNGVVDGIVYAAMVGLGFAFAENVMYYTSALALGQGSFAAVVVMRGGFSPFTHPLFTAMTGIGLAQSIEQPRLRRALPFMGLGAAMALHAIWNASTYLGGGFFLVYLGVFLPLLGIVIAVAWLAARREGQIFGIYLTPDIAAGLLTAEEVTEVASLARRREVLSATWRQGGDTALRARRAFHHAAAQLAFLRHRARPNAPDVEAEMALVREIARYKRSVDAAWVAPLGIGEF